MKLLPNYLEYFISPITGKLASYNLLPALEDDYVWEGNYLNRPIPSPVLIDMRLTTAALKNQVDIIAATYLKAVLSSGKIWVGNSENKPVETSYTPFIDTATFVLKTADAGLPNAQALDELDDGVMINTAGVISTSEEYVKFPGTSAVEGNIAIFADATGRVIADGGMSIPDLEELVEEAEAAAAEAKASAEAAASAAADAISAAAEATAAALAAAGSASAAAADAAAALISAGAAAASATSAASSASDAEDYKDQCQAIYDSLSFLSTMTDGQLIIGKTGLSPVAATLTAGSGVSIVNGAGTITISASGSGGTVTSVSGTANRITSSGGTTPVIDIDAAYVGQSSITTLGTITTGTWNGSNITETRGGTNQTSYTLGDILYSSATNTLSKLSGNTTSTVKYLSQTGTGTVSAAPVWSAISGTDITGAALTKTDDTNVTLTLGGSPTTALLRATSLTLGWTGQLSLARGGTAANLTASNGGIFYSTATAGAILAGNSNANKVLLSGASAAPTWSSATYPSSTTINQLLYSSAANTITGLTTANNGTLVTNNSGVPSILASSAANQMFISNSGSSPSWKSSFIDYGAGTTGGLGNLFAGTNCGKSGITGNPTNTGFGIGCLASISTSGSNGSNTCGGYNSGTGITTGAYNTLFGYGSGFQITTGGHNTFYGNATGIAQSSYNQCLLLGSTADCGANGLTNAIAIGYGAIVNSSNSLVLGNGVNVGVGTSSPKSLFSIGDPSAATTVASLVNLYNTVQNSARIVLTGQEVSSNLYSSNEGIAIALGLNRSSLRGVAFQDSTHAFNTTNIAIRFTIDSTVGASVGEVAATSTDSTVYKPLKLGGTTITSVTDSVYKPTAGGWLATSDIRIKKDIKEYTRGLKEVLKLKPTTFKFNKYSGYTESVKRKRHIGLIADDVLKVMPECIGKAENKKFKKVKTLDVSPITYALVNAVKELNQEIIKLKKAA